MDSVTKPQEKPEQRNGVFVRGVVVSNRAKPFKRKDGSGITVVVEVEIATQPGVVVWTRYFDPKTDSGICMDGEKVIEFPRLKELEPITIKAERLRSDEHSGQLIIRAGELLS